MTPWVRLSPLVRPFLLAGALAATLAAGAAAAETKVYSYQVELAEPAKKSQVHAGNVLWECRAKQCVASARGGNVSVKGCRELAGQVGRVVSYASEIKHLGKEQLDVCNALAERAVAAQAATATTAAKQSPSRVTTEELTYTGVHQWNPAR